MYVYIFLYTHIYLIVYIYIYMYLRMLLTLGSKVYTLMEDPLPVHSKEILALASLTLLGKINTNVNTTGELRESLIHWTAE